MWEKLTLRKVIDIVKLSILFTLFWPLPKDVNKLKVVCVTLYHYLSIILHISLLLGEINTIKNHSDDPVIIVNSIVFVCADIHVMSNIVAYRITSHRLQLVTFELEDFCKSIKPYEEAIYQRYIDKCLIFYGGSLISTWLVVLVVILGTITMDQPFPANAEYPFDMYQQPIRSIIFIHQVICAVQTGAQLCNNIFIALLLWFISARFELLIEKLRAITDIYDLMKCVQEHQKLLKYAEHVIYVVRPFAFIAITCSTISLIILGLIFITDQPLQVKIQCIGLGISALSEVFMYTWPAEHLIQITNEIGEAVYNLEWYEQSLELRKSLQTILMRAQKPLFVSIPCVMPSLCLSYYASYLSTIFSYFTTLRTFMQNSQDQSVN